MTFTSRIAWDLELLITRTQFDPIMTKKKLDLYVSLNRITQEEYDYLLAEMEEVLAKDTAKQLETVK